MSGLWNYFKKCDSDPTQATCMACRKTYSFKTSITNLKKHLRIKHVSAYGNYIKATSASANVSGSAAVGPPLPQTSTSQPAPSVLEGSKNRENISSVWKYFKICDKEEKVATCQLCRLNRSYKTSITNLKRHLQRKHHVVDISVMKDLDAVDKNDLDEDSEIEDHENLSDMEVDEENKSTSSTRDTSRSSIVWLYYERINERESIAQCKLCNAELSYESTTSNLKKHFAQFHSDVPIPKKEDGGKHMLFSAKGKLFEIDDEADEHSNETDPIGTSEVYVTDFDAEYPDTKIIKKTKAADDTVTDDVSDSSSDVLPFARKEKDLKSLDLFGKYIVSLMKQLPPQVANRLQVDFVNQIMNAQTTDIRKV